MNKTGILIVNINNLKFTMDCIDDLRKQTVPFDLTVVDQNSSEPGTKEFLKSLNGYAAVIQNDDNIDLNKIWNNFYKNSDNKYICLLNNDVRIPKNFIEDGEKIFEIEEKVGCVVHSTNHPEFNRVTKFKYAFPPREIKQGWDPTFRKEAYEIIPEELKVYCGDDFLFEMLYRKGYKTAFALSSPIIHYQGMSEKARKEPPRDVGRYIALGFSHRLKHCPEYSRIKPTFKSLR